MKLLLLFFFMPLQVYAFNISSIALRMGQGGFNDGRSPVGKLGGGQIALDAVFDNYPIALSLSGEYYTNSPEPTSYYEISDMTTLSVLYNHGFERVRLFGGAGGGWLKTPVDSEAALFSLEAGASTRLFRKISCYGTVKCLYSQRSVVDFNELIMLIGFTVEFNF